MSVYRQFYAGKKILVTGGTGSIGSRVVLRLLQHDAAQVVVLGRTEFKHERLNQFVELRGLTTRRLQHRIGDVSNYQAIYEAAYECDFVFHIASMKYVPQCEDNVFAAVQTNILGAQNVRNACVNQNVKQVVVVSSDKAAKPVSVMGMTKYLQERVFTHPPMPATTAIVIRFGNVLGSEGSVVWTFKRQADAGESITLTDPDMTRFMMSLKEGADLVVWAGVYGLNGNLVVKQMKIGRISDLAALISPTSKIHVIGIRPGEKVEETLLNDDELKYAVIAKTEIGNVIICDKNTPPTGDDNTHVRDWVPELLMQGELKAMLVEVGVL